MTIRVRMPAREHIRGTQIDPGLYKPGKTCENNHLKPKDRGSMQSNMIKFTRRLTEPEERRHHRRDSDPWLRIETEGFAYIARDWSTGGTAIPHFHDSGPVGTLLSGEAGWASDDTLSPFIATIVRRDQDGNVALRWLDADPDFLMVLDHAARRR